MLNFIRQWLHKLTEPAVPAVPVRVNTPMDLLRPVLPTTANNEVVSKVIGFVWKHHAKPLASDAKSELDSLLRQASIAGINVCLPDNGSYQLLPPLSIPYRLNYADGYWDGTGGGEPVWKLNPDARLVLMACDGWMESMATMQGMDQRQVKAWLDRIHQGPGCDERTVADAYDSCQLASFYR